jgi:hypothetical protein
MNNERKAQGAIEYLLLLAAAIVVVAIVISFLASTIGPTQDAGTVERLNYLCNTLDANTRECRCYKQISIPGFDDCCGSELPAIIREINNCS